MRICGSLKLLLAVAFPRPIKMLDADYGIDGFNGTILRCRELPASCDSSCGQSGVPWERFVFEGELHALLAPASDGHAGI
jgi:hypothetical protein